jgi:dihydrofolate reductase
MKQRPGKDMRVGGGATLLGSLMNHGLIDELRLVVYPIVLAAPGRHEAPRVHVSLGQAVKAGLGASRYRT